MDEQHLTQVAKSAYEKTGSPYGVMAPHELAAAATQQWQRIRQNVSIEDRAQFEPILESLLGRATLSSPESFRTIQSVVGAGRGA